MDYNTFCKRCQHYAFDLKQGILCGLSKKKPSFGDECPDFLPNPEKEYIKPTNEKKPIEMMKSEIRNWGIGLIILGFIHIIASGLLNPIWGVLIIILGILNILIINRVMFIINGLALFLVGILNIISTTMVKGSSFWFIFGIMQLGWGFQEIRKYSEFSNIKSEDVKFIENDI